MTRLTGIAILLVAAIFEAGGDALMRAGLQANLRWQRALFYATAALVLFAYGWTVNAPRWDFGKLLGIYIVFFFLVAQILSWLVFKQVPSLRLMTGGLLIVAGGVVIAMGTT